MMDDRLSKPKAHNRGTNNNNSQEKIYINTAFEDQAMHQSIFSTSKKSPKAQTMSEWNKTFDKGEISRLNSSFVNNYKYYNQLEKQQNLTLLRQAK